MIGEGKRKANLPEFGRLEYLEKEIQYSESFKKKKKKIAE